MNVARLGSKYFESRLKIDQAIRLIPRCFSYHWYIFSTQLRTQNLELSATALK